MSTETTEQTVVVKTEGAAGTSSAAEKGGRKCAEPDSDHHHIPREDGDHHHHHHHIHREDVKQIWKECHEESFWYRALPLSVGSMAVTGGLIYSGVWKSAKTLGPFPKLAVAGVLGFAVGKASYVGTCRSKFQAKFGPGSGPGFGPGFGPGPGRPGFGPGSGHRHCHHVCEECKKQAAPAPAENVQS